MLEDQRNYIVQYPSSFLIPMNFIGHEIMTHEKAKEECKKLNENKMWYQFKATPINVNDLIWKTYLYENRSMIRKIFG